MWLNELQIALAEQDPDKIKKLLESMPHFDTNEDIETAAYLLKAAFELISKLKNETAASMQRVKKNIEFLNSTQSSQNYKLDIKS